jgi:membrane associated rhomboid family serine protease
MHRDYQADRVFPAIWLLTGFGTWLIGRQFIHIGASGIIYGLVTYIVLSAWWLRTWKAGIWAALILLLYGGIFYGVLPRNGFISWEAHLSGALAGVIVAKLQHQ